jgi:hypothetical protein
LVPNSASGVYGPFPNFVVCFCFGGGDFELEWGSRSGPVSVPDFCSQEEVCVWKRTSIAQRRVFGDWDPQPEDKTQARAFQNRVYSRGSFLGGPLRGPYVRLLNSASGRSSGPRPSGRPPGVIPADAFGGRPEGPRMHEAHGAHAGHTPYIRAYVRASTPHVRVRVHVHAHVCTCAGIPPGHPQGFAGSPGSIKY